jgi:hypothetical protein
MSTEALPDVAERFLYTNSPGQLHYTLAFFRIAVGENRQTCGGLKPGPTELKLRLHNRGIRIQI